MLLRYLSARVQTKVKRKLAPQTVAKLAPQTVAALRLKIPCGVRLIAKDVLSDDGPRVAADVARTPVEYAHAEATWRECLLRRIAFGEGGSFAW